MTDFDCLPREFFEASAREVAPRLIGQLLVRKTPGGFCGGPIVEVEAYLRGDPASHAAPGLTERNRTMFGAPGHAYVYFIYGVHYCVNAVCCPPGIGEAVLIRAIEATIRPALLRKHRPVPSRFQLTNGPGKLCAAMKIDRQLDGADLCDATSPLFVAQNRALAQFLAERGKVAVTPRIGLTKATELPLRFCLENSPWLSRKVPSRPNPAKRVS